MFRELTLVNFRCFGGLLLKGLERINLIAGKNNTGKTALLEGIRLHCDPGNPGRALELAAMARGTRTRAENAEEILEWLFLDADRRHGARVATGNDKGENRSLSIYLVDASTALQSYTKVEEQIRRAFLIDATSDNAPRLMLHFEGPNGEDRWAAMVLATPNPRSIVASVSQPTECVLLNAGGSSFADLIDFFGRLESANRQGEILPALQILESRLKRLALIPFAGGVVIHGDVGLSRLVPVSLLGEGTRRVLSIVLAIANVPGGVVLIDEIENGLHHSVLSKVWKAIADAARRENVQIFATTHSWECLRAAHEAFSEEGPYDFRLHRLDRINDNIEAVTYDQEMIATALEMGLEVR